MKVFHAGLTAGVKDSNKGRQTVFLAPLDLWEVETEEEFDGDLSKPRTVHHKSKWKESQDACSSIHFNQAQQKGLNFWQTRSRAIIFPLIASKNVFRECRENFVSQTLSASACSEIFPKKCLEYAPDGIFFLHVVCALCLRRNRIDR